MEEENKEESQVQSEPLNGRHEPKRKRSRSPIRRSRSRSRSPRNWRRGERNRDREDRSHRRPVREGPGGKVRLYVCNMPYDMKWQDLKDLFKNEVGPSVTYVEMYENLNGKPSGAGAVEVKGVEQAEQAIEKMDRFEINDRKIIVREERDTDRARHKVGRRDDRGGGGMSGGGDLGGMGGGGGGMGGGRGGGMGNSMSSGGGGGGGMGGGNMGMGMANTSNVHGISPQIMQQLNIDPNHVTNQVFVANLDYKVNDRKVREIFKMAGNIVDVDFKTDDDGKSRGMCVLKFEHPVEAVQAISMFNGQILYERTMTVKMDKLGDTTYSPQQIPSKLPSGLKSIGMGLGSGGTPVNVQQFQGSTMTNQSSMGMGMGMNTMGGNTGMGSNMMGTMGGMNLGGGGQMGGGMGGGMNNMSAMGNMGGGTGMGMANLGGGMGNMGTGMGSGMGTGMGGGMGTSMGGGMGTNMGGGMGTNMGGGMGTDMSSIGGGGIGGGMRNNSLNTSGMGGGGGMGTGMSTMGGMGSDLGNTMGGMGTSTMGSSTMGGMGGGAMGGLGSSLGGVGGSMGGGSSSMGVLGGGGGMDSYSNSGLSGQESTTVFVRNLPFSYAWQDLKTKFSKCGEVKYVELKMENGKSKGFGTVKFVTSDEARRAVNLMNGARIDGRQIEVRLNKV